MSTESKPFAAGSIFSDEKIGERVATYDEVRGRRFGGSYTTADVAMGDYDYREESGDRDGSEMKAAEDVARINVSASQAFGNPRATSRMTPSQRVHSMWYRYAETMSRYDASTAKLLNELAFAGWQAGRDTAERLADEKFKGRGDKGGFSDRFLVVAQTEGEARIVRAWMDMAMRHVTDGQTLGDDRPLRFNTENLPPVEDVAELLRSTRPGLEKDSVIGVVAAPGAERAAVRFMAAQDHQVMPGAGRQLWNDIGKNKSIKLKMLEAKRREQDQRINERVSWEADRLVVFMSGDAEVDQVVMPAAARAFQRGTLAVAFDAGGNEISQFALGEEADRQFPSRAVEQHLSEIQRFMAVPANSPEGRLFLSLLPKMSRPAIDALSNTERSVGDLLALARSDDGRATLFAEFKLASEALVAMSSGNGITAAGAAWDRIKADCSHAGVVIVGPESFPGNLRHDPHAPAVLFVQAKDPRGLAGAAPHVLMAGDDGMPAWMARRSATLAQMVAAEGAAISQLEGCGQPGRPIGEGAILWLATGHGHADVKAPTLEWSRDRLPSAVGPASTWEIQKKPLDRKDLFELIETRGEAAPAIVEKIYADRIDAKAVKSGRGQSLSDDEVKERVAQLSAEKTAETVSRLKSKASAIEAERAREPAFAARKEVVEAGGYVVSAQPPREKNLAYRYQTRTVSGFPTVATQETRRETARLAVNAAEALCVTYTRGDVASSAMIGAAVEGAKGMIAVSVPQAREYSPAVERQVALYTRPGRQLAELFNNLPGDAKLKLARDHAEAQICGMTGEDPKGAAGRVANRVNGRQKARVADAKETRKAAERELA